MPSATGQQNKRRPMRYTLYTEKTVAQCLKDLNGRLQAKATKASPGLEGWIEKKGDFALKVTTPVIGRFKRTTRLTGHILRERGVTIIQGYVADGVGPGWLRLMGAGMVAVALLLALSGQYLLAVAVIATGLAAYIPLRGDYVNSDILLIAVEKTLKASPKPPKQKKK